MADHHGGPLLDYIRSCVDKACGELARRLAKPIATTIAPQPARTAAEWAEGLGGELLLAAGALSGQVEGGVCFAAAVADALNMARALCEDAPPEGQASLREADSAAVVFFLARLGAEASDLAVGSHGIHLAWPSDPASLSAQVVDLSEGPEPLVTAVGGEECCGFEVSLGEPLGASFTLLVCEPLARSLESALAGGGRAADLARVLPVAVPVRVVLGRRTMALRDLLRLVPGETLELDKLADEPLELEAGGKPIARGSAIQADDCLALRIVEVTHPPSRQS